MSKFKRVLLKMSGEILSADDGKGIDFDAVNKIAKEVSEVVKSGVEMGIVVGGGNIWRYRDSGGSGIPRVMADKMGMLATVMNGIALQSAIENNGQSSRVCSAVDMTSVIESYRQRRAVKHLERGRVVICVGGTGNPYFTTDTAAALRALELNCDALLKATNVDGVYDSNPKENPDAKKFEELTYTDFLAKDLKVMDATAVSLCRDEKKPIILFDINKEGNIMKAVNGDKIGTVIH